MICLLPSMECLPMRSAWEDYTSDESKGRTAVRGAS
jgi:hypothetical protein